MSFITMYVVSNSTGLVNCVSPSARDVTAAHAQDALSQSWAKEDGRTGDLLAIRVSSSMADELLKEIVAKHFQKAATMMRNFAQSIEKVGDIV